MRLLRVRFTLGTLLLTIAVVAANCSGFRHHYAMVRYQTGKAEHRSLPHSKS